MAHPQYSYAMPNTSQIELDSSLAEEFDDYDPNFFDGISFNKKEDETNNIATFHAYPESPSPSLTGYTSEESDYSSVKSVDEHSNGKWSPTSDASNTSKRMTINEGMMTNGKTSMFRGVTRTSKTAWGAKYSSKRIVNTCKTEEEAARKYDEYLKLHVPDKYLKYANFCPKCDQYTNSLGLQWATKTCKCQDGNSAPVLAQSSSSMEQQALVDFLKDEHIDLTSPYYNANTLQVVEEPVYIKQESVTPMLRSSSSIPDDEILTMIVNAPIQRSMFGSFHAEDDMDVQQFLNGVYLSIDTIFLRKYFRNDRKNLQCFPYCREHGNYYEAKMNGLEHTGKGVCRAPVKVKVHHATSPIVVLARCQRRSQPVPIEETITAAQLQEMQNSTWVRGTTSEVTADDTTVYFLPEVWKFDGELPKKRRVDDHDVDDMQYCVQVVLFYNEGQTFKKVAVNESNPFDIQSTRTLLRQKQRKDGDDNVLLAADLPEKKKIKLLFAQHQRPSSIIQLDDAYTKLDDELVELDLERLPWAKEGEAIDDGVDQVQVAQPEPKTQYLVVETPKQELPTLSKAAILEDSPNWKERFVVGPLAYSALNVPLSVFYLVVHVILLPFVWLGSPLFHISDGIADLDLYFANSLSPPEEPHVMLNRVTNTSALVSRIGYYVAAKLPVTLVAFVGSLVLNLLAVIALIVPPLSRSLRVGANSCGMLAVQGCKGACGQKTSAHDDNHIDQAV
ncbi:hypothetical protein AeMF1_000923 [Aphanomyces euteiches]|nr:hypothetical protein AeMF1_000923 [Aphanomyces euteiches]KAH9185000.1 hypothetical protein AeNC1_013023 [Aphanomyces euteiches]